MKTTVTLSEHEVKMAIARYVERVRGGNAKDSSVIIHSEPRYTPMEQLIGTIITASVEIEEPTDV